MRGHADFNYPTFNEAERFIWSHWEALQHELNHQKIAVHNPARNFNGRTDLELAQYLELCLRQVDASKGMLLLNGWQESQGARLEIRRHLHNGGEFWYAAQHLDVLYRVDAASIEAELDQTVQPLDESQERMAEVADWEAELLGAADVTMESIADRLKPITTFASGATRDTQEGKLDYEGFLSPLVLTRYAEYMDKHRLQSNGELRDSDNWQRGFPRDSYVKSGWRHWMDVWSMHRGLGAPSGVEDMDEAICATMFNLMGLLHERLLGREAEW